MNIILGGLAFRSFAGAMENFIAIALGIALHFPETCL
jgi:hypothetical protein